MRQKPYLFALPALAIIAFFFGLTARNSSADAEDPLVAGFRGVTVGSVADAVDQITGKRGFLDSEFRPVVDGIVVGRARTALLRPAATGIAVSSGAAQHVVEMIDSAKPGEVGVIVIESGANAAGIDGLMATAARARGMAGMLIDGGVRDVSDIRRLGFPVYAKSVTPGSAAGRYAGVSHDEALTCGGVLIRPGDIIIAGEDGVVVVPKEEADDILKRAVELDERAARMGPLIQQLKSLGAAMSRSKDF
ncbi:MAG: RraA family protein [Bryobacterales bacterium]|nr:RraA family protein [Bryobacterales bacterium]